MKYCGILDLVKTNTVNYAFFPIVCYFLKKNFRIQNVLVIKRWKSIMLYVMSWLKFWFDYNFSGGFWTYFVLERIIISKRRLSMTYCQKIIVNFLAINLKSCYISFNKKFLWINNSAALVLMIMYLQILEKWN